MDEPWVSYIISGAKTWEMRSRNTGVRGRIGLIRKGAKTVVGVADLVGTLPKLSLSDLRANVGKHQVSASEIDEFSSSSASTNLSSVIGPLALQVEVLQLHLSRLSRWPPQLHRSPTLRIQPKIHHERGR
jgi:hypothetical protein